MLSDWPMLRLEDWVQFVNEPQTPQELEALRRSVNRGSPFGDDQWIAQTIQRLDLAWTLRPRDRPVKRAGVDVRCQVDRLLVAVGIQVEVRLIDHSARKVGDEAGLSALLNVLMAIPAQCNARQLEPHGPKRPHQVQAGGTNGRKSSNAQKRQGTGMA